MRVLHFAVAAVVGATALPFNTQASDPVIVTATRTAQTADASLAAVTVISRDDIERSQARSVDELLRAVPGLNVTNAGGAGKTSSVFMRGTESDHVLVLIDGVRIGSASLGLAPFQDLPVDSIERIEVVRGPRSSLYGSEAIGGVIQIFTREGSGELSPYFSAGIGRHSTRQASAGVSGALGSSRIAASVSRLRTDGFDACRPAPPPGGGCFTDQPDDDGYSNTSGSLRLGHAFANGADLEFSGLRATGDVEFDGDFQNEGEFVQQVLGTRVLFLPADTWQVTLSAGRNRDVTENFLDGVFMSRFTTVRDQLSWQNDIDIGRGGLLTAGIDHHEERVGGTTDYTVDSRDNTGVFGQYQASLADNDWLFGLRHDDNEQFGSKTTGNLGWGRDLGNGLRMTAGFGTAFKAPSFNDLYFPGFGNPDLGPETSNSFEIGLAGGESPLRWGLNAFHTTVDDLIAFDASTSAPANIEEARIRGIEGTLGVRVGEWDLRGALTLLDAENRGPGMNRGNELPRRAGTVFSLDADRGFGAWRIGGTLHTEGSRYDDIANTERMSSFATVDVRAEYGFAPGWSVGARVTNLFDEEYETAKYFNQDGRNAQLLIRYQPGAR